LIVVVDEYEHEGLRDLRAPAADAAALSEVLGDPDVGDFAVQVISNQPSFVVAEEIEGLFSTSRSDDELLLHFSCHGLKSEAGELFFAARNTRPDRLRSTAVAAEFVQRCMRVSRSRSVVLLLDCCYGGAFGQGMAVRGSGEVNLLDSFPRGKLGGGRGRAVITACSSMEYAFEGDQLTGDQSRRPSVFTNAVVAGLASGDADRDHDGLITLDELYDYVFDRVQEQNPNQTPSRDIEMQGEFVLARSRRQARETWSVRPGEARLQPTDRRQQTLPHFHRAVREVAAAGPGDAHIKHLIQLIIEGARYYQVAAGPPADSPAGARQVDSWRRAVAELDSDETIMIKSGALQLREITDTMRRLATEIAQRTGVYIPLDEF
jgi:hypothetical protein